MTTYNSNLLPKYWKLRSKYPYGMFEDSPEYITIYGFMVFDNHRTVLFNKKYNRIGTMERRYAKLLIEEAREKMWINNLWINYKNIVKVDEHYPSQCPLTVLINASVANLSYGLCL